MGRVALRNQIKHTLESKSRIGESRHAAKAELREREGENYHFGQAVDTIHSLKTFRTYQEHCDRFAQWCIENKGVSKYATLEKIERYAPEYLAEKEREGLSLYSLKAYKSALGKLYGHEIEHKFKEQRTYDKITRSRQEAERDKHFSEERNKDLVTICRATGGRREDIAKLSPDKFFSDRNGTMWVRFEQSKGGRDRVTPVLPQYKDQVKEILQSRENPHAPIFDHIHGAADVHGYRREYARALYNYVKENPAEREKYAERYPERREDVKGDTYYSHSKEHPFKGKRDDVYIVSQALGHNRLEVTVNHYLK